MNDSTIADCAVRGIPMIPTRDETGFSLLELLIAMAVFLVAGAASFTLFSRHQRLYGEQQGLSALNISLRGADAA
jgi:prepilin-type N-terminal cleavage/methylation domain-containing protein